MNEIEHSQEDIPSMPHPYISDIGKAVVLANAKIKILDERITDDFINLQKEIKEELQSIEKKYMKLMEDMNNQRLLQEEDIKKLIIQQKQDEITCINQLHDNTGDTITNVGVSLEKMIKIQSGEFYKAISECRDSLQKQILINITDSNRLLTMDIKNLSTDYRNIQERNIKTVGLYLIMMFLGNISIFGFAIYLLLKLAVKIGVL